MFKKINILLIVIPALFVLSITSFAFSNRSEIKSFDSKPIAAAQVTTSAAAQAVTSNEAAGGYMGIFREGAPGNIKLIKSLEKAVGRNFTSIMWYLDWSLEFPQELCDAVIKNGAVPHIVWEPWLWSDRNKIKLDNIVAGEWDEYITKWALGVKKWGGPVYIRWAHEFNIGDYPWGIANNKRNPDLYVNAFRHVHDIFTKVGALNAKWIWCPMQQSWPQERWNDMNLAYPGDDYVDWIGIDGYNWGTTQPWSYWQSFKEIFRNVSRDLWRKHPAKPIMIAEFACAENGGDKAAWILGILPDLKRMRYIKAINWFDLKKETDWRINSSAKSFQAFKNMANQNYFDSDSKGFIGLSVTQESITKRASAVFTNNAPIIDGDLSEWKDSSPLEINQALQIQEEIAPWTGTSDLSGKLYVKWDDKNLYIGADVIDDVPFINLKKGKNIWNGDAIEVTLGLNSTSQANRDSFQKEDYQIGFGIGSVDTSKPSILNWTSSGSIEGGEIAVKRSMNPSGYVLEVKIPWAALDNYQPAIGRRISFDVALDDADSKDREKQMVWSGDYLFYKDPGVWGELELIK